MEIDNSKCSTQINELTGQPYLNAPTSCEATSYCKSGTCVDVAEGICQENTPKTVCEKERGSWYDRSADDLIQCQLGCCYLGDQAAFVTQTRCKTLSSLYNLEINFRSDITSELICVASANPYVKGACVIETEEQRTCEMLTKEECQEREAHSGSSTIEFHEGFLCSAPDLATDCGPSRRTTCVEDEDEVYFLDLCNNVANVYDYSRINDINYWTYIQEPTCGEGGNENSRSCGNCEYYPSGTVCKSYREANNAPAPFAGEYICGSLDCQNDDFQQEYRRDPEHGESWCVTTTAESVHDELGNFLPGAQHYIFKCWEGEVLLDPCEPSRATICNQTTDYLGFEYGTCELNQWQDCIAQETQEECEDRDSRDCQWIEGLSILKEDSGKEKMLENENGQMKKGSCVPLYPPTSQDYCSAASIVYVVNYSYGLTHSEKELTTNPPWAANDACEAGSVGSNRNDWKKSTSGCYALIGHNDYPAWSEAAADICRYLGDCGVDINYIGVQGENERYMDYGEIG